MVISINALSVLSKLLKKKKKKKKARSISMADDVDTVLVDLAAQTNLTLWWIPAHSGTLGNEQAHWLAKKWGQLDLEEDR